MTDAPNGLISENYILLRTPYRLYRTDLTAPRRTFDVATDDDAIAATEAYFARPAVRSAGNITVRVG